MITCSKNGCDRRPFMDSDRCFDHQGSTAGAVGLAAWLLFCGLLSLALIGVGVWAVVELVQWVTSQ